MRVEIQKENQWYPHPNSPTLPLKLATKMLEDFKFHTADGFEAMRLTTDSQDAVVLAQVKNQVYRKVEWMDALRCMASSECFTICECCNCLEYGHAHDLCTTHQPLEAALSLYPLYFLDALRTSAHQIIECARTEWEDGEADAISISPEEEELLIALGLRKYAVALKAVERAQDVFEKAAQLIGSGEIIDDSGELWGPR